MPSWDPKGFSLTIANGKKHTQAIAFNAEVVSHPTIGLKLTHHKVPISATETLEIQELFQQVRAPDGGRLFYHVVNTDYNVQGCVAVSLVEEASKFSNFTLLHLLRALKLDDSHILSEAQNETRQEIEKSFTLKMLRRAKDVMWDKDKKICSRPWIVCS